MGVQENQITSQETNDTTNGNNNNNNNSNSGSVLVNGATTPGNNHRDSSFKGNEDRKIFVGGIAYDVTNDDLTNYFSQFGEVSQAQVKFDRTTGRSRGFAFVEFATADACKVALNQREQQIKNKQCEIKPAKSRENKKVFVGGLPATHPEEDLRKHFEQYGKVEDIEWPFDKQTKARRNFAFIVFEEEEVADRASSISKQTFGDRECDVKKAVPQSKRNNMNANNNFLARAGLGGLRGAGGYGGGGGGNLRGAPALAVHNAATQWFNNGWPQMTGVPYPAAGAATAGTTAGWGDWYGNAASAANFYAQNSNNNTNYGAYANNGYDYNQGNANGPTALTRQPQNGTAQVAQRF